MRTLLTHCRAFVGVGISHAATIIDANSANISGDTMQITMLNMDVFSADGKVRYDHSDRMRAQRFLWFNYILNRVCFMLHQAGRVRRRLTSALFE